ncbi:RDD family protein [Atopomonas sediminilitoris]|uniref:RDD family protein n=1 Tax=Atopomonas sediminilitoris TaxID=2919919 RepID=UPI001F4EFE20|nr:RDD family protein [Atopomonas sediminilitoris]MCJ8170418.1 RDD family protein [Atopomonas sediminilitoris]
MNENPYQAPQAQLVNATTAAPVYAGFWLRVLAALIDSVLVIALLVPLFFALFDTDELLRTGSGPGFTWDIVQQLLVGTAVVLFWHYKQATPGKLALRMRVVDAETQQPVSIGRLVLRYVGYIPSMMVLFIGVIWVAFDSRKQGWHDKMASTVVIRDL